MTSETDLASRWLGGSVIAASDESFGEKENLLTPAPAAFEPGHYGPRGEIVDGWETGRRRSPGHDWAMIRLGAPGIITSVDVDTSFFTGNFPQAVGLEACGWETRRRRDGGHDHVVFRLAFPGVVRRIVLDTAHFKYNASAEVTLHGSPADHAPPADPARPAGSPAWRPLLARTRLQPDTRHEFAGQCAQPVAMVRLDAFPDGGLSRVRLIGRIDPQARRAAGYRWFNALPPLQALQCLADAGLPPDLAAEITARRPLAEGWPSARRGPAASYQPLVSMLDGESPEGASVSR